MADISIVEHDAKETLCIKVLISQDCIISALREVSLTSSSASVSCFSLFSRSDRVFWSCSSSTLYSTS